MKTSLALAGVVWTVCVTLLAPSPGAWAQEGVPAPVRTIVGDLLMIDRDLYILRGDRGEVQIEATPQTAIAETFQFGDRIKASVLPNNKALTIERAGPDDVPGVTEQMAAPVVMRDGKVGKTGKSGKAGTAGKTGTEKAVASASAPPPSASASASASASIPRLPARPTGKIIVGDLLMIDRDLYILRGDRGEVQIEATPQTVIAETFQFGDRIKASVLPNNRALTIERAGPDDVPGVVVHGAFPRAAPSRAAPDEVDVPDVPDVPDAPVAEASGQAAASAAPPVAPATQAAPAAGPRDETRVVEGRILMVDGDFYVIRGELGEIRVERTPDTRMTETFTFGDAIKATVTPTDRALSIERLR